MTDEQRVGLWIKRFALARDAQSTRFNKFADYFNKMYAIVNDGDMAAWRSKIVIPVLAEKAWHIISKLSTGKAGWNVIAKSEEYKDQANNMEDLLNHQYDNPLFDKPMFVKLTESLIDAVVTGTAVAKVPWVKKTRTRKKRVIDMGVVDLTKAEEVEEVLVYNDLIPVNIFDVYIAPKSTSLQDANWVIIRSEKTLADLKKAGVYKNLDKVEAGKVEDPSESFKLARQALTNREETDPTSDIVEILECYDRIKGSIITIANKSVVIREQKNEYWHGKYPLVAFNIKPRSYDFWGEGIFEVTERLAAAINDTFNHYMDNWNLATDAMLLREKSSDVDDFVTEPGAIIEYRGPKPEFTRAPEPNAASLQNIQGVMRGAIDGLTISPYSAGVPTAQGADKTQGTATGIIRLQEAAQDLLGFMRYMFKTTVREIGTQWMSNNLQYLDRPVNIIYKEGLSDMARPVWPEDIQGEFELMIDASVMEPVSKEMKRDMKLAFINEMKNLMAVAVQQGQQAQMAAQMGQQPDPSIPFINVANILEGLAEDFGIKDFDKWTERPEMPGTGQEMGMNPEMPMQDPNMMMGQENLPPMMPPMEQMPPQMMDMSPEMEMPVESPEMPLEEEPQKQGFLKSIIDRLRRK